MFLNSSFTNRFRLTGILNGSEDDYIPRADRYASETGSELDSPAKKTKKRTPKADSAAKGRGEKSQGLKVNSRSPIKKKPGPVKRAVRHCICLIHCCFS